MATEPSPATPTPAKPSEPARPKPTGRVTGGITGQGGAETNSSGAQDTTGSGTPGSTPARGTALEALILMFRQFGLEDLARQIGELVANPDLTDEEIYVRVYDLDAYKARFPAMDALRKKGYVMDEKEYLATEKSYRDLLGPGGYGLPAGFYDQPDDFAKWLENGVSPAEVERRIVRAKGILDSTDPGMREAAAEFYGLSGGDLLAYFIDGERSKPLIERQANAITMAGAGRAAGFQMDKALSERLGGDPSLQDVSYAQASGAFQEARQNADANRRIANIEGDTYSDAEAIDAVLLSSAEAKSRQRARLDRENSRFGGSSAVTSGTLAGRRG